MQGVTVILHVKTKTGEDSFGNPVYADNPENVDNVLIGPAGPAYPGDIAGALALTGQHAAYQLYVPKGDSHRWDGALIDFFGRRWKAVGTEEQWIEELIPLEWNKRVSVERYVMPEDLDKTVTIIRMVDGEVSDEGFPVKTEKTVATCPARVTYGSGEETVSGVEQLNAYMYTFLIPYAAIDENMIIRYAGHEYRIKSIRDYEDAHEYMLVTAERKELV